MPDDPIITRNKALEMYAAFPEALEAEVARLLRPLASDEDRVKHNAALSRFITLFETEESERLLWTNVARAIIATAQHSGERSDG